jgi:hypothetical protein
MTERKLEKREEMFFSEEQVAERAKNVPKIKLNMGNLSPEEYNEYVKILQTSSFFIPKNAIGNKYDMIKCLCGKWHILKKTRGTYKFNCESTGIIVKSATRHKTIEKIARTTVELYNNMIIQIQNKTAEIETEALGLSEEELKENTF